MTSPVIVDIGATVTRVTVVHNGHHRLHRASSRSAETCSPRTSPASSTCRSEEAEAAKRVGNLPENFGPDVLQPVQREDRAGDPARAAVLLHLDPVQQGRPHPAHRRLAPCSTGWRRWSPSAPRSTRWSRTRSRTWRCPRKIKPRQLTIDAPSLMVACGLRDAEVRPVMIRVNLLPHREEKRQAPPAAVRRPRRHRLGRSACSWRRPCWLFLDQQVTAAAGERRLHEEPRSPSSTSRSRRSARSARKPPRCSPRSRWSKACRATARSPCSCSTSLLRQLPEGVYLEGGQAGRRQGQRDGLRAVERARLDASCATSAPRPTSRTPSWSRSRPCPRPTSRAAA